MENKMLCRQQMYYDDDCGATKSPCSNHDNRYRTQQLGRNTSELLEAITALLKNYADATIDQLIDFYIADSQTAEQDHVSIPPKPKSCQLRTCQWNVHNFVQPTIVKGNEAFMVQAKPDVVVLNEVGFDQRDFVGARRRLKDLGYRKSNTKHQRGLLFPWLSARAKDTRGRSVNENRGVNQSCLDGMIGIVSSILVRTLTRAVYFVVIGEAEINDIV